MGEGDLQTDEGDLGRRLDGIWERTKSTVFGRIDTIERSAAEPDGADLAAARTDAHKLRGLLGTIGLSRGSELAGAIEDELEAAVGGSAEPGWEARVAEMAAELRAEANAR